MAPFPGPSLLLFEDLSRRDALERAWLDLTRHDLPAMARRQGWALRDDHCFQRVILDAVCGGPWMDMIVNRLAKQTPYRRPMLTPFS